MAAFFCGGTMSEQEKEILVETASDQPEIEPQSDGDISADVVNISQGAASNVKAEIVRISQGGAEQVIATEVELKQGGANRIQAQDVKFSDGAAAFIQASSVTFTDGGVGAIRAQDVSLEDGGAGVIYSERVNLGVETSAGVIVAQQVSSEKVQTKVLLAGNVEGDVETVMNTQQALFAGMAAGAVIGFFLFLGQLFSRRK
jgi:hypothetical protein